MTDINFIKEYTNNDKIITDDKLEYLQCEDRLKGYVGERQSGKTFLLYQDLILNVLCKDTYGELLESRLSSVKLNLSSKKYKEISKN